MTTQQMAVSRLVRREAPKSPNPALQFLTREGAIACELHLVSGELLVIKDFKALLSVDPGEIFNALENQHDNGSLQNDVTSSPI
jgi:hypothetical protein